MPNVEDEIRKLQQTGFESTPGSNPESSFEAGKNPEDIEAPKEKTTEGEDRVEIEELDNFRTTNIEQRQEKPLEQKTAKTEAPETDADTAKQLLADVLNGKRDLTDLPPDELESHVID